tara:strand:- start:734 stop:892 length:159 start_codon:yes stop_codon:yes gene_type:complete
MSSVFNKINISNKRAKDETYQQYRERLMLVNKIIKEYMKGTPKNINQNNKKS